MQPSEDAQLASTVAFMDSGERRRLADANFCKIILIAKTESKIVLAGRQNQQASRLRSPEYLERPVWKVISSFRDQTGELHVYRVDQSLIGQFQFRDGGQGHK